MKTKSTGYLILLDDGSYQGFWKGHTVTVPFTSEEVTFDVCDYVVSFVKVFIKVIDGIAYVETI